MSGTMAPYAEQVLICTGKDDWESNIAEENAGDNLAADIKELVGRGGIYADVCKYVYCLGYIFLFTLPLIGHGQWIDYGRPSFTIFALGRTSY
jgi:hypothetical protein